MVGPKGGVKHVLCAVSDITSNVLLAKELQEAQENANAQVDMMVGMLHVDPLQLGSFLDTTETGLQLINAILKEPARTDAEFRKKLGGLFRELHSIKGEASALNLMSIANRVHHLEDTVSDLKKKAELSGNDFLPMVLKLDELLAHLRGVREMATRLTALKDPAAAAAQGANARPRPLPGGRSGEDISPTLQALAEKLAKDHRKAFKTDTLGAGGRAGAVPRDSEGLHHPDAAQCSGPRHRGERGTARRGEVGCRHGTHRLPPLGRWIRVGVRG